MEGILALAAFGALLYFIYWLGSSGEGKPPPRYEQEYRRTPRPHSPPKAKSKPSSRTIRGRAYVTDGDGLRINKTEIRLFGIDAPESNHPYGNNAKWALIKLCKGKVITAEVVDQDAHGRSVAKCTCEDGLDLSAEMVKQGLAIDWPKFSGGCYRHLEPADARRKLWLADARQKGRMDVWEKFEAQQRANSSRSRR